MSYTTLYAVFKTKASEIVDLRNSWGSGPAIWDYVALKCTGKKLSLISTDLKWFWKLWESEKIDDDVRACLLSTYDYAVVEVDRLLDFEKSCQLVYQKIIAETAWTWNHFWSIGIAAGKLAKKHDHRCIGMGIGCTSVSDPWKSFDPEKNKIWGIYKSIDKIIP